MEVLTISISLQHRRSYNVPGLFSVRYPHQETIRPLRNFLLWSEIKILIPTSYPFESCDKLEFRASIG